MTDKKDWLVIYLKGLAMGAADAVPGVSGGTIALITGIYERFIEALSSFNLERGREALSKVKSKDLKGLKDLLVEMDVPFLLVLGLGVFTALVFVLNIFHFLLENLAVSTYAFFFGLILASAVHLYTEVDVKDYKSVFAGFLGFVLAFTVSGLGSTSLGHSNIAIFISGAVAVSAMILPGISGSLILVVLGQYDYISEIVTEMTEGVFQLISTGETSKILQGVEPVTIFVSGAVIGVLTLVKFVNKAFKANRKVVMAFLTSLMLGALRSPYIQIEKSLKSQNLSWIEVLPELTISIILGVSAVLILDRKTESFQ